MKSIIVCLAVCASVASAAMLSSSITLYEPVTLNGTELKPGEYKLRVDGDKLSLRQGKTNAEAQVKTEQAGEKYLSTSIRYSKADGKTRVSEIRIGGTKTKLLVN